MGSVKTAIDAGALAGRYCGIYNAAGRLLKTATEDAPEQRGYIVGDIVYLHSAGVCVCLEDIAAKDLRRYVYGQLVTKGKTWGSCEVVINGPLRDSMPVWLEGADDIQPWIREDRPELCPVEAAYRLVDRGGQWAGQGYRAKPFVGQDTPLIGVRMETGTEITPDDR